MKTRKPALAAAVAAAMISVAGCSATPAPAPSTATGAAPVVDSPPAETTPAESAPMDEMPSVFSQGDFYFVSEANMVGKFTIPGKEPADLESLRNAAGAPPVSYLSVKLDGRQATDSVNMYALTLFDPDGKKYEFHPISDAMEEWRDRVGTDDTDLYNRFIDASNAEPYMVDQAEVGTLRMFSKSTTLPTEITRVAVWPAGVFEETEAYPVSMGQGLDLDF